MTQLTAEEEAASARAAEQTRLRKARREAKLKAGAESRLKTITGLGGGVPRDIAPTATAAPSATTTAAPASATPAAEQPPQHDDPEEVVISEHFYQPQATARVPPPPPPPPGANISDAQLRQMMLGFDQPLPGAGTPPPMPGMLDLPPGMEDDPMMRMMMQMMGGGGGSGSNPFAGMGGMGGMGMPFPPNPQQQQQPHQQQQPLLPNRQSSLWRLLHTTIALALGLYIALYTPFTGTKLSRDRAAAGSGSADAREQLLLLSSSGATNKNFFWAFATAEAVLLGSRYVAERGRSRLAVAAGGSGVLGLVVGFLPGSVRGKVELAMRYAEVLGTVKGDVLVCVFVLGVAAWWQRAC
ncbi:hypothetical protein BT67DRAFT_445170 [Trichocladium antarcticum]|uniref:GET complex subunit GET2 n=1 Tax=Trichocladium antarcticum TaxID=1450529 RepID=A0AAN6UFT8_9PEZI|nr:hypothetical protein BT67DRAFT_445170 [Trichocladium antarcticum]